MKAVSSTVAYKAVDKLVALGRNNLKDLTGGDIIGLIGTYLEMMDGKPDPEVERLRNRIQELEVSIRARARVESVLGDIKKLVDEGTTREALLAEENEKLKLEVEAWKSAASRVDRLAHVLAKVSEKFFRINRGGITAAGWTETCALNDFERDIDKAHPPWEKIDDLEALLEEHKTSVEQLLGKNRELTETLDEAARILGFPKEKNWMWSNDGPALTDAIMDLKKSFKELKKNVEELEYDNFKSSWGTLSSGIVRVAKAVGVERYQGEDIRKSKFPYTGVGQYQQGTYVQLELLESYIERTAEAAEKMKEDLRLALTWRNTAKHFEKRYIRLFEDAWRMANFIYRSNKLSEIQDAARNFQKENAGW